MKASEKVKRTLKARQRVYDEMTFEQKKGTKRPGSLSGAK